MDMVPRSGGVVREYKKEQHLCHCEPSQMAWQSLFCCCVARALMRPVRILVFVQTALALVFTYSLFPRLTPAGILVFVQTALALVFTYSDSSRGSIATVAIQWIIKSHAFACVHNRLDCFAALAMTNMMKYILTNMMKYILPGPRGQKAPHKNIRFCGDPAPRGDKKYPYMIFLLQDFVQTNRINTKHMPNPNHRLD